MDISTSLAIIHKSVASYIWNHDLRALILIDIVFDGLFHWKWLGKQCATRYLSRIGHISSDRVNIPPVWAHKHSRIQEHPEQMTARTHKASEKEWTGGLGSSASLLGSCISPSCPPSNKYTCMTKYPRYTADRFLFSLACHFCSASRLMY